MAARRALASLVLVALIPSLWACPPGQPIQTVTTNLVPATGTAVLTSGIIDPTNTCSPVVPPPPDPHALFDTLSPAAKRDPFVGFQIHRNTTDGCLSTRLDVYRAYATFDLSGVGKLKGLVKTATLAVKTHALPPGVGLHPSCIAFTGGAGTLIGIGANMQVAPVAALGILDQIPPAPPFPSGGFTEFTFPNPWTAGSVAGAATKTTTTASGAAAIFSVDVTSPVTAAINGGRPSISWMLTSALESISAPATGIDCRTSYEFALAIEHY